MSFGPSEQAMLAASQAASAEQRQSFLDALNFSKEQLAQARADRAPYMQAGNSALQMWTNLLGLQPGLVDNGGGGGGLIGTGSGSGTLRSLANSGTTGSSSGSTGRSTGSAGSANMAGTATGPVDVKFPGYVPPPYQVGPIGKEKPVPGDQPPINNPDFDPFDTTGLPPFYPYLPKR